jgi:hypothetical protein
MPLDANRLTSLRAQIAALDCALDGLQRDLRAPEPMPQPSPLRQAPGYRLFGQDFPARNGNDTLSSAFRQFAELEPRFPERFAQAVSHLGRARPYVGRSPQAVYPGKPNLWAATVEFAPSGTLAPTRTARPSLNCCRRPARSLDSSLGAISRSGCSP